MVAIKSPSEYLSSLKEKISKEQRLAFLSAFIIGFFCHLYIFTNSMYNNDDIRNLYINQDRSDLGRWLLTYAAGLSSYFSLPVVNGILSLIFLGLTAMILIRLFDLKNRINIILVSGILVVFPSVACTFSYMFTADAYFISCFLAALSVYLVCRCRHRLCWIYAAVCFCISLGIYQAYLTFILLLLLLWFVLALLEPEKYSEKQLFSYILRFILMLGSGMAAYYGGLQLTLRLKQAELSSYQGINQSAGFELPSIKERILILLTDFFHFFKPGQILAFNHWMEAGLSLTLLLLLLFFITLFIKNKLYLFPTRMILLFLCITALPFCSNTFYLISGSVNYHLLMRHSWCLLFIGIAVFYEKAEMHFSLNKKRLLEWAGTLTLFLVVWNYILLSNIAYFNMNFRYEKTYALCLEVRDKMKESDDYDRKRPIAFIGNYSKTYKMDAVTELLDPMVGMKGERIFKGTSRAYLPFFQNCIGEDITVVTPQQEEELENNPEVLDMPRFPHDGCIRVINDITVVKLNDK